MTHWFDRAEKEICEAFDRGEISYVEYQKQMKDLRADLRAEAESNAEQAYNDTMGW